MREAIIATAPALGLTPLEFATVISFETGGTFDPVQPGPVTKWGRHRGPIQFGEPQARQYGVDWNNPIGSQFGPEGAIVKYALDRGYRPGMGLLDFYSTVNAGAPGKYNASDTAAGGTWGTVRDKVDKQFGPHRAKALKFLGIDPSSQPAQPTVVAQATPRSANKSPQEIPAPAQSLRGLNEAPPPTATPAPAAPTVARLLGTDQPKVTALLAALADQGNEQQQQQPTDPRQMFAANYEWARRNGWRV